MKVEIPLKDLTDILDSYDLSQYTISHLTQDDPSSTLQT